MHHSRPQSARVMLLHLQPRIKGLYIRLQFHILDPQHLYLPNANGPGVIALQILDPVLQIVLLPLQPLDKQSVPGAGLLEFFQVIAALFQLVLQFLRTLLPVLHLLPFIEVFGGLHPVPVIDRYLISQSLFEVDHLLFQ